MLSASRISSLRVMRRQLWVAQRNFTTTARACDSNAVSTASKETTPAVPEDPEVKSLTQAPNRTDIWSRSQKPRSQAMTGPRFEQTNFELQPQPYAAIELIHKQPVKWTHERVVVCDGGGGPAGHPRIFINTDKPEISVCNYCGLPYANEHHRTHLEKLPETSYLLS